MTVWELANSIANLADADVEAFRALQAAYERERTRMIGKAEARSTTIELTSLVSEAKAAVRPCPCCHGTNAWPGMPAGVEPMPCPVCNRWGN